MAAGKRVQFARTAKAATGDRLSKWELIEAIAADAVDNDFPISGAESCVAARAALDAAGNDHSDDVVKHLCMVAKFDVESTPRQRKLWREYGWTSIRVLAKGGWTQADAYELLRGEHKSRSEIERAIGAVSKRRDPGVPDLDEGWTAWLTHLNKIMMEGARLAERSDQPGVILGGYASMARVIYQRMTERQLDAEIRDLLSSEEAK